MTLTPLLTPKCQEGLKLTGKSPGRWQSDFRTLPQSPPPPGCMTVREKSEKATLQSAGFPSTRAVPAGATSLISSGHTHCHGLKGLGRGERDNGPGHTQDSICTTSRQHPRMCSSKRHQKGQETLSPKLNRNSTTWLQHVISQLCWAGWCPISAGLLELPPPERRGQGKMGWSHGKKDPKETDYAKNWPAVLNRTHPHPERTY